METCTGEPLGCGWFLEPQIWMTLSRKWVSDVEEEVATHAGGGGGAGTFSSHYFVLIKEK